MSKDVVDISEPAAKIMIPVRNDRFKPIFPHILPSGTPETERTSK